VPGVSNSTPLLYLAKLGDLSFLPGLFGPITVPQAVWRELVIDGRGKPGATQVESARGDWLTVATPSHYDQVTDLAEGGLEIGEAEAIILAAELGEGVIFMDDERGVLESRARGFEVVRTPAVYFAAKRRGWIDRVQPKLDRLRDSGFRLRAAHYQMILGEAGEL
jgi:uncharacterized protein